MGELLEKAVEARAQLHDVISLTDVKTRVDMQRYPAFPPILPPSPSFDYHFILRTRSYHVISPYCFHPSPFCFAPYSDGVYGRECPTEMVHRMITPSLFRLPIHCNIQVLNLTLSIGVTSQEHYCKNTCGGRLKLWWHRNSCVMWWVLVLFKTSLPSLDYHTHVAMRQARVHENSRAVLSSQTKHHRIALKASFLAHILRKGKLSRRTP